MPPWLTHTHTRTHTNTERERQLLTGCTISSAALKQENRNSANVGHGRCKNNCDSNKLCKYGRSRNKHDMRAVEKRITNGFYSCLKSFDIARRPITVCWPGDLGLWPIDGVSFQCVVVYMNLVWSPYTVYPSVRKLWDFLCLNLLISWPNIP